MDASDKVRFAQIMAGMADNFRDSVTKDGMDMLRVFSIEQVEKAAMTIMATRKYTRMPPVAEFIEALQGQAPKAEDIALVVANSIIAHMRAKGSRVFPPIENDPVALKLMKTRWPYYQWASEVLTSELQWWVKQFCEAYKAEKTVDQYQQLEGPQKFKQIAGSIGKPM